MEVTRLRGRLICGDATVAGCEVCAMTGTHGNGFTENDDSWPPSPLMTMTEWIANGWFIVWKMGTTCEPIYIEVSREMGQDRQTA